MNRSLYWSMCSLTLGVALIPALARTQDNGGGNAGTGTVTSPSTTKTASKKTSAKAAAASNPDIAAAQSSGKVWVNTDTRVYHKNGRWYGKTKKGKFMTESEAKAAGYKQAQKE